MLIGSVYQQPLSQCAPSIFFYVMDLQPAATHLNCMCTANITHQFRPLGIPLTAIYPRVARNQLTITSVALCHKKVGDPWFSNMHFDISPRVIRNVDHAKAVYVCLVLRFTSACRAGAVGIANRYGLDGGTVGTRFCSRIQTGPRVHPASCPMGNGSLSLGV